MGEAEEVRLIALGSKSATAMASPCPVAVTVGVELEGSVDDGVAVSVRDSELLGVPERVAELLEVPVVRSALRKGCACQTTGRS